MTRVVVEKQEEIISPESANAVIYTLRLDLRRVLRPMCWADVQQQTGSSVMRGGEQRAQGCMDWLVPFQGGMEQGQNK